MELLDQLDTKAPELAEAQRLHDAAEEAERQERATSLARKQAEDAKHIREVHEAIAEVLQAAGVDADTSEIVLDLIRTGQLPNVTINY